MTTGEKIRARRKELGMSADALAEVLGKNRATVYRYESDEIEGMPTSVILPIATALNISPAYLMGWSDKKDVEPTVLPKNMRKLVKVKRIPKIGRIACGTPLLAVENIEDYILLPDGVNADFALTCCGDSMTGDNIYDGDTVFIRQQPMVESGEVAAVLVGEEATLKHVYLEGDRLTLMPSNQVYRPMVYVREEINEIRILGKATSVLHYL